MLVGDKNMERHQIILPLDFPKQEDVMFTLKDTSWDLSGMGV